MNAKGKQEVHIKTVFENLKIILLNTAVEWLPFLLVREVSGLILDPEVRYSDLSFVMIFLSPCRSMLIYKMGSIDLLPQPYKFINSVSYYLILFTQIYTQINSKKSNNCLKSINLSLLRNQ